MADVHDKATRSKNMRAIATRDTAIEKRLASVLNELGIPYRVQDASLPGKPDFIIDDYQCVMLLRLRQRRRCCVVIRANG